MGCASGEIGEATTSLTQGGKRAAAIMSLVHSAKLNGHDPYAYLRDVMERLPTQPNSRIQELLPQRWQPLAGTV
jgi:transposase